MPCETFIQYCLWMRQNFVNCFLIILYHCFSISRISWRTASSLLHVHYNRIKSSTTLYGVTRRVCVAYKRMTSKERGRWVTIDSVADNQSVIILLFYIVRRTFCQVRRVTQSHAETNIDHQVNPFPTSIRSFIYNFFDLYQYWEVLQYFLNIRFRILENFQGIYSSALHVWWLL